MTEKRKRVHVAISVAAPRRIDATCMDCGRHSPPEDSTIYYGSRAGWRCAPCFDRLPEHKKQEVLRPR